MIIPGNLNNSLSFGGTGGGGDGTELSPSEIAQTVWEYMPSGVLTAWQRILDIENILDLLTNNATVVLEEAGTRLITIFDDDGETILRRMRISADGLIRTRLI